MNYSPQAVTTAGYVMMGLGMTGEVSVWLLGQVPGSLPGPGGTAGTNAFWLGVAGLLTIVVNGIVADRHNRRSVESGAARFAFEADRKLAEAKAEALALADRMIAEAKAEADRKLAEAKTEALALADRKLAEAKAEADRMIAEALTEADRRIAEAKSEADRKLANARHEADRRVSLLEERLTASETDLARKAVRSHDQMNNVGAAINDLQCRAHQTAMAVNALAPAVQANARALGTESPEVRPLASPLDDPS